MFTQVRPFNTAIAGSVPNLCLDNVRRGYSILNKYGSAWMAWQHTEQHPDRNIPLGLDVPLYYSYTTTINNVTANYGHINVRLANGTVWSDGKIYANIDAYLAGHAPKFVGWGESVNDYKIIEGEEVMTMTEAEMRFRRGLATGNPNLTNDELEKYYKDSAAFDQYLAELQKIQGITPTDGTDAINATMQLAARRGANQPEIDKYRLAPVAGIQYGLLVQQENGVAPQPIGATEFDPYNGEQLFVKRVKIK